jgi:hypothetical protein
MSIRHLNKRGTNLVFVWTELLSREPDMIEITEKKAKELIALKEANDKKRVAAHVVASSKPVVIKDDQAGEKAGPDEGPDEDSDEPETEKDRLARESGLQHDDVAGAPDVDAMPDEEVRARATELGIKAGKKVAIEDVRTALKAALGA